MLQACCSAGRKLLSRKGPGDPAAGRFFLRCQLGEEKALYAVFLHYPTLWAPGGRAAPTESPRLGGLCLVVLAFARKLLRLAGRRVVPAKLSLAQMQH